MGGVTSAAYRSVVQKLMHLDWYRVGADPLDADDRIRWHFRHGHHTDGEPGEAATILADTELAAMLTLRDRLLQGQT